MNLVLFWSIAVALTVVVTLCVLWPVLRKPKTTEPTRAEHDLEVYGAQLVELDGDLERGAMAAEEVASARAEIGRRLLKAAAGAKVERMQAQGGRVAPILAVVLVGLGLPMATLCAYLAFGSPDMPDLPLEARLAVDPRKADLPTLVAQVERRLHANPDDGAGWDMLAPIYLRANRAGDAVEAYANAIRLVGATPEREGGLGEALAQAASGEVTPESRAAFERALALNPDYLPAKFFLALDLSQEERFDEARPAWQALIDASPEGAPWLEIARLAVADAEQRMRGGNPPALPGPTSQDIAAAGEMSDGDRRAMIEGMVSQLGERLKTAPNDVEGWKRLIRSYKVLGDDARARAALGQAEATFADGTPERGEIAAMADTLGLSRPTGTVVPTPTGTVAPSPAAAP